MAFTFKAVDFSEYVGGSYLMDFGEMTSQEDAALVEGKLLTAFGAPQSTSQNYEDSFNYFIHATADDGRTTVLNVYGAGLVHIGAKEGDSFTLQAANALVEYVNSFAPTDYSRTVHYMDACMKIDIAVENGIVTVEQSELSEEEVMKLFSKLYKDFPVMPMDMDFGFEC